MVRRSATSDEARFSVMRLLETNPRITQRELARALGISLGKANNCVRSLTRMEWIKVVDRRTGRNRVALAYLLTPEGIKQKARLRLEFLRRKVKEYETLADEIRRLRHEGE